jgi:ribosomal protein S18 acetylase RimI-like enzyme
MPDSRIRFRDFEDRDLDRILDFKKESAGVSFPGMDFDMDLFRRKLLGMLRKDPNSVKVAELGNDIIGYVFLEIKKAGTGSIGCINHVFVSEPHRNSGLGASLVKIAEDYLRSRGIRRIRATVTKTNQASLNFCRKLGYKEKRLILEKTLN